MAQNVVHCREDAEDVVQETFLRAFRHLHDFEERSRFSTWLMRIALNVALMKVRCSRRLSTTSIDEDRDEMFNLHDRIADWRPNPEQLYGRTELQDILQRALSSLPHGYRIVFMLRDIEGVSVADTAAILGLTVCNTKVRLTRARLKLREHLSQYFARTRHTTEESRMVPGKQGVLRPNLALEPISLR
jgi:RNA polymerase sigma-70 factor (ECF subfamily)